jgi:hypothetical protein
LKIEDSGKWRRWQKDNVMWGLNVVEGNFLLISFIGVKRAGFGFAMIAQINHLQG